MPIELNLISVLSNENRKKILKICLKSDICVISLQRALGVNYCTVWRHLKILRREKLIKFYKMLPKGHGGRPFKMVTPTVTKEKIRQLDKKIKKFKELKELLREDNKEYRKRSHHMNKKSLF